MNEVKSAFHIAYLTEELARRRERNSGYSLRAFAKQLQMHPSALSRILHSKQELTTRAAITLIPKIAMTETDRRRFMLSVAEEKRLRAISEFESAFSISLRDAAS